MSEYMKIWTKYVEVMKPIEEQRAREIKKLQDECPHVESEWVRTMWAPGHFGADILQCKRCGKNLTPTANAVKYKMLRKGQTK